MAKKRTGPALLLSFSVNGHALTGENRGGRWSFTCPDWPELARRYDGAADTSGVIAEFMGKALAGAVVTVKRLAEAD